jgi:hypothetical protein
VLGQYERTGFLVAGARHDARRHLEHQDFDPLLGRGGCDFEADKACADDDKAFATGEIGLDVKLLQGDLAEAWREGNTGRARAACSSGHAHLRELSRP